MIDLEILREILSGVKTEHKNSLEASSIINEVWKEVLEYSEPERKKGKWIFIHPLQADDEGAYICSNCRYGDWDIKPTDKYCKFCGADMRKGREED